MSRELIFVPEGHLRMPSDLPLGICTGMKISPIGTAEIVRFNHPSGTRPRFATCRSDKSLGYFQPPLTGL